MNTVRKAFRKLTNWWLDTFTLHRWALNPFQMYDITFLMAVAVAQVQLGATPGSVYADNLDRQTLVSLAVSNIIGAIIALLGLHIRDLESALWVEFWGYMILIFVLGFYVILVTQNQINPNASYGFALAEAFVYAAIHRSVQILLYKRARRKRFKLMMEADFLRSRLMVNPPAAVIGDEDEEER